MDDPIGTLRRGKENPGKIPSYAGHKARDVSRRLRYQYIRRRDRIPSQKPLVNSITDMDEYALIILDACRYDVFADVYDEYLRGTLKEVWATGRWTGDYARRMWDGYTDLDYISAAPVVSDFYFNRHEWGEGPTTKFRSVTPLWETHWDRDLGTVHPADVTNSALDVAAESGDTRLVAHYLQPHFPYIGGYELQVSDDNRNIQDRYEQDAKSAADEYLDAIESGRVATGLRVKHGVCNPRGVSINRLT